MFGNFLYFIIVLLIYLTYQPSEETYFSGLESLTLFMGLIAAFFYLFGQEIIVKSLRNKFCAEKDFKTDPFNFIL